MFNVECPGFFCFSDTIAEQDLSDLIVPPPQCKFVLILFLALAGSLCFLFSKLEKLRAKFINMVIIPEVLHWPFFSHTSSECFSIPSSTGYCPCIRKPWCLASEKAVT